VKPLKLDQNKSAQLNVLCLGAHCDDIEIGCGGTLLTLFRERADVHIYWQIFTSTPSRKKEAVAGAERFCSGAKSLDISILDFKDGFLPYEGSAVKDAMEAVKSKFSPDVVLSHYRHDLHQDHRKISELTWNTFRNHLILEYEIPKWDGDLGNPNTYIDIAEDVAHKKIAILQEVYNTQREKNWFTDDLFWSLMRIRGMESNAASSLAEGFYLRKATLDL
jgi:LmbE family N-acetylglucosaminyl deacetylase